MDKKRINTIRDLNKRRVIEYIIANQPTSRVAIAKDIRLTKATISSIVSDLINENILIESKSFQSTGGRKPTKLIINEATFHVIAIDYFRGYIKGALININGEILAQDIVRTLDETDLESSLNDTYSLIDSLLSKLSNKQSTFRISISIDGSVKKDNSIKLAHTKKWENINLNHYFEKRYSVKCYTNNEANLAALGENNFFRQNDSLTVLSMHTGVGLGTIQDYALIEGHDGLAGEIGHTIVNINGIPCSCGNKGCIEQYASVSSLINKASTIKNTKLSFNDLIHLYQIGDTEILSIFNDYCLYLGVLITNTVNLVNPKELVIANEVLDAIPSLLQTAMKYVNLTVSSCNSIRLSSSNNIKLLGAAAIAIQDFLSIKHFYPKINH
jgi:predicted NBD/HSP70 family sugar kinase